MMRVDYVECDECHKQTQHPIGWYEVTQIERLITVAMPPLPWHLCSLTCLGRYAERVRELSSPRRAEHDEAVARRAGASGC